MIVVENILQVNQNGESHHLQVDMVYLMLKGRSERTYSVKVKAKYRTYLEKKAPFGAFFGKLISRPGC